MDYSTLRTGDQGQEVIILQRMLNKAGNYGLDEDGVFGEQTEGAVKSFQGSVGLTADGIVGPLTWASLSKKAEISATPANISAINWQKVGLWSALALGAYMIYKRLGGRFGGYYDNEGDEGE